MFPKTFTALLMLGSMATAAPSAMLPRQATTRKLLVGGPSQIMTADFDGAAFTVTSNHVTAGTVPSWMRYNPKKNALYAVDENSDKLYQLTLDSNTKKDPTLVGTATGSAGVVFLEFNKDQTRMVGAGYGSEEIDIWDVTDSSVVPKLLKSVKVEGSLGPGQKAHHPHQALLDPTGDFMVIPDLGGDQILVLDTRNDKYEISNAVTLPSGTGPRHGGYIKANNKTFYALATELSNKVILFELDYSNQAKLEFIQISSQSTYSANFPPANSSTAAAGTVAVASNNRDVYITNRLSGNETDSIAHFVFSADANPPSLVFADTVSVFGIQPRDMRLSTDESLVFVANQGGANGLVALQRCSVSGRLAAEPVALHPIGDLVPADHKGETTAGPQFVQEI